MERASVLIHRALDLAGSLIRPGIQTLKIAEKIHSWLITHGAEKSLINISPENLVWHGVPGQRTLGNGEIVTVDIACSAGGYWSDAARTFTVGDVDEEHQNLVIAAWEGTRLVASMMAEGSNGLETHKMLQQHCRFRGVALVPEGAGHAIGHSLHQQPTLTYDGRPHMPLLSGRAYTAEPVFTTGNGIVSISRDGIAETRDKKPSAYFEVTVYLADNRVRICGAPDWLEKPPC